jgi:hypothetical protein
MKCNFHFISLAERPKCTRARSLSTSFVIWPATRMHSTSRLAQTPHETSSRRELIKKERPLIFCSKTRCQASREREGTDDDDGHTVSFHLFAALLMQIMKIIPRAPSPPHYVVVVPLLIITHSHSRATALMLFSRFGIIFNHGAAHNSHRENSPPAAAAKS